MKGNTVEKQETTNETGLMSAPLQNPALLSFAEKNQTKLFLQFSGQAESYFDQLKTVYEKYPATRSFVETSFAELKTLSETQIAQSTGFYQYGFDGMTWLQDEDTLPPQSYLSSSPISQAMIFITQVAEYLVFTKYGYPQSQLFKHIAGLTGHSQGVMAATLVSLGKDGDDFLNAALDMIRYLFWQGLRMQEAYPLTTLPKALLLECEKNNWGNPTNMAAVSGLTPEEIKNYLELLNGTLPEYEYVNISLINGWKRVILSGSAKSLVILRRLLAQKQKKHEKDLVKTFSVSWEFLKVSAPFHCPQMHACVEKLQEDVKNIGWQIKGEELLFPVYATNDGRNLQASEDLVGELILMQSVQTVDWNLSTKEARFENGITHIIDFGPGQGASTLTFLNREGDGVAVIPFSSEQGKDIAFTTDSKALPALKSTWKSYQPQLVTVGKQKNIVLKNRYSEFTGCAPVFGGGMTPTSVETEIVTAAANEGYIQEWAGGGQPTEAIMKKRLDEIKNQIEPGRGIVFNALYLDAYLWNLHYPLLTKFKKEGYPIIGLTISAGVPSLEKAVEIFENLNANGIWLNSLKPGSDSQIKATLEIADALPQHTLIVQVEGGKAGGHHSWEDLYGLLERNYAAIRRRSNVILCAGGGVGTEEQAWKLIEGTWHESGNIMPIDAVILGTRLMAVKEAKTSPQVKELLVETQGSDNWLTRHEFTDGMTSGQSQLGADVHYTDNTMSRVADKVDLLSEKTEEEILAEKDELVELINKTSKPYFGDVATMTYGVILSRLTELLAPGKMPEYFAADGPFFDVTYRQRLWDFYQVIKTRFAEKQSWESVKPLSLTDLDDPQGVLNAFLEQSEFLNKTIVHPEDVDHFMTICRKPGKPVNFVPVIDKNIKKWFKGDSLWQAHDPRYAADEVLVIPGPEAVKGITKSNEPIAEVFNNFVKYSVDQLQSQKANVENVVSLFEAESINSWFQKNVAIDQSAEKEIQLTVNKSLDLTDGTIGASLEGWSSFLGQFDSGILKNWLETPRFRISQKWSENFIAQVLYPKAGSRIQLIKENGYVTSLSYFEGDNDTPSVVAQVHDQNRIHFYLYHNSPDARTLRLDLDFIYSDENLQTPFELNEDSYQKSLLTFYQNLWLGRELDDNGEVWQEFQDELAIDEEQAKTYLQSIGDKSGSLKDGVVSPAFSVVLLWKPLASCLLQSGLNINLLNLLHLSHQFKVLNNAKLKTSETVHVRARLESIQNDTTGKTLTIVGTVSQDGIDLIQMTSQFLVRQDVEIDQPKYEVHKTLSQDIFVNDLAKAVLSEKAWAKFSSEISVNDQLAFALNISETYRHNGQNDFTVSGKILSDGIEVGVVSFQENDSNCLTNPVLYTLEQFTNEALQTVKQESGLAFEAQKNTLPSNHAYALASFDYNPIHTDNRFAALGSLINEGSGKAQAIVHGMWTSAASLSALSEKVAEDIIDYKSEFLGKVYNNEKLIIKCEHTANIDGHKIYQVVTETESGQLVHKAQAEIAQPKTAYVFTGQGSQVQGMGMSSYENSEAARAIWDRADLHCQKTLGFSILKIVKDNPKKIFVDGSLVSHPKGVLHLTQFTQVSLTILAMAQITELREAGIGHREASFAGHSLGEYAALNCFDFLSLEDVVDVVYNRGLTMQNYVPRDEAGASPFGMVVVRPRAVGWSEEDLEKYVSEISSKEESIYVVNYNIEGSQYSVTGHKTLLKKLETELEKLNKNPNKPACIWIEGVDVPFHSPLLRDGVDVFRNTLCDVIKENVDYDKLVQRYVPNLNAKPFSFEKSYVEDVHQQTDSPVLKDVLKSWSSYESDHTKLGRLLLIELLAYQFASPVQWIKTQKLFLTNPEYRVDRILEIGPSPVLARMMMATMAREWVEKAPEIVQFEDQKETVFFKVKKAEEPVAEELTTAELSTDAPAAQVAAPAEPANLPPAQAPEDQPYSVATGLKALLALKLGLRKDEVKDSDTVEGLSGGNSAKRNELLSDIGAEFEVDALDDGHTMPLSKLVDLLENSVDYKQPGPVLQKSIDRALKESLPLSKNDVLKHFGDERVMGDGLSQSGLVEVALLVRDGASRKSGNLSPIGLSARIADKSSGIEWLNKMVDAFGDSLSIKIPFKSQIGGGGAASAVSAEALEEWENKFFGKDGPFASWAQELSELCGWSAASQEARDFAEELEKLKLYQNAFGSQIEKVFASKFDVRKAVSLDSYWNWGRTHLLKSFWTHLNNDSCFTKEELTHFSNTWTKEMNETAVYLASLAKEKGQKDLANQLKDLSELSIDPTPLFKPYQGSLAPSVSLTDKGDILYREIAREGVASANDFVNEMSPGLTEQNPNYVSALKDMVESGINFSGKVAILTGASPGSIAWDVMKNLLEAGATVIATTTSYNDKRLKAYRALYQNVAGRGAQLHVFPFSQGSDQDIQGLVNWCFNQHLIPDYVFPFGAIGETATLTMMNPDSSTATLRVLLQGVQWLIGAIAQKHKEIATVSRKTLFVLPLSPNHGVFGGDGAYADSKISLEALLNRWHSEQEDWGEKIALTGASIGWVRGTGLMDANNLVASAMEEKAGMRTFSTSEMSLLLTTLCHPKVFEEACQKPLRFDFTGGFGNVSNLPELTKETRETLEQQSQFRKSLLDYFENEKAALYGEDAVNTNSLSLESKASLESSFPKLAQEDELKSFQNKANQKWDSSEIIAVVGYGEVSPFGSSQPRFEMECGELSPNGALELAWIMGLIKYEDGSGKSKTIGWVDASSGKAISDTEVLSKYRKEIEENSGIRFTDSSVQNFDPRSTVIFGSVTLEKPLVFSVENQAQAQEYLKEHGDSAEAQLTDDGWVVTLKSGSQIKVPRRVPLTRWVSGQIPKGWDATRFGVTKDLVDQVDRTTLYNLVASASALNAAGLRPEEVTELYPATLVGNSQGGGMGGMTALDRMYHDHREDKERQGDTLQETLINVNPAWVTQSLVGSYGPMVHPVAACATALVSLNVGVDLIHQGKADFIVAGGYDDYSEEGVIGFQDMAATCDTQEMLDKGIEPKSMSRPNDSRRGGFVEAQGGGTLLLTRLDKAIEHGLPIYSLIGFSGSYSDGVHTSIPAPGLGLLGVLKENSETGKAPLQESLEKLGLTTDDITVISKHDTSTNANDPNENKLHDTIQKTLKRTPGNPLYVHSQKSILGHAKGGAGAWQSIAAIQMLNSGKIPGNKNLENVDGKMQEFSSYLSFLNETLTLGQNDVKGVLCTSLGFGHVGAITLFVNPNYALAGLSTKDRENYLEKRNAREKWAIQHQNNILLGKAMLYDRRTERPSEEEELKLLMS